MATTVRIELNRANIAAMLRSPEALAVVEAPAQRIAAAAGEGFEVDVRAGATRARASVRTATYEAMRAEAVDKILTAAIDAGRG